MKAKKSPQPRKPVKVVGKTRGVSKKAPPKSSPRAAGRARTASRAGAAAKTRGKAGAPKPTRVRPLGKRALPRTRKAEKPRPRKTGLRHDGRKPPKAPATPTRKPVAAPAPTRKPPKPPATPTRKPVAAPAPIRKPVAAPTPIRKPVAAPTPIRKSQPTEAHFSPKTPKHLHFRMPAEWEPHFGTWMTWPNKKGISFPGKGAYDAVLPTLFSMVRALLTSEDVFLNISSAEDKQLIRDTLTLAEQRRIHFIDVPAMEPWCRDHGCTFLVRNHDRAGGSVVWKFNAWGGKYEKAMADSGIGLKMAQYLGGRMFNPGIVLEGGAIEVNGSGTLLTTESCLLNKNRNKGHKREDIERILKEFLGVTNVLWLPGGIDGDDTDGHIDDMTRFVSQNSVITMVEDNPRDKNYAILQRNTELLRAMKAENGSDLEVVTIPMPQPIARRGQRLPASYANFYVGNKMVLLPTFEDGADEKALEVMVKSFPGRRIYPIDCRDLVWGLGAFHCLTQQVPLAAFPKVVDLVQNPPQPPRPVY